MLQNSLGKGSVIGLSQAHSRVKKRLGLSRVEVEGKPQLVRNCQAL